MGCGSAKSNDTLKNAKLLLTEIYHTEKQIDILNDFFFSLNREMF